jgi:uncharacterized phiE125 gp8 family phage protein
MGSLVVVTPPAAWPVSVAEARQHLRVDVPDEDVVLQRLIEAATQWCENYCARRFISATLRWRLDRFPAVIELPRAPVQSVTQLQYIDGAGTLQTLSSTLYQVDLEDEPARVAPAPGFEWPSTQLDALAAVRVEFVSGYGATAADVPQGIREAVLVRVGDLYAHRESVVIGTINSEIQSMTAQHLLGPYQRPLAGS